MPLLLELMDFGIDLGGAVVESFPTTSIIGLLVVPEESVTIPAGTTGDAVVTLHPAAAVPHLVRLSTGGIARFRSGLIDIDPSDINATNPRRVRFAIFNPDPPTVDIPRASVTGLLPALPLVTGAMTVTTMTLFFGANLLRVTGAATHRVTTVVTDPFGLGFSMTFVKTTPVTYLVDFRFLPRHGMPPGDSVIRVKVLTSKITGASGGLLGTIQNALVNVVTDLVAEPIRKKVESELQDKIDDGVAARLDGQGLPAEATVTVETVTIDGLGIHMTPVVGMPGTALGQSLNCAGVLAPGSVRFRKKAEQDHMRAVRDRLLARTPQGSEYLSMLGVHMPEIVSILLSDRVLLKDFDSAVRAVLKEFPEKSPEKGRLSKPTATKLAKFLTSLGTAGSDGLGAACTGLAADVNELVGADLVKSLAQGWEAQPLEEPKAIGKKASKRK